MGALGRQVVGVVAVERLAHVCGRDHAVPRPEAVASVLPFVEPGRGVEQSAQDRAADETVVGLEDARDLRLDLFGGRASQELPCGRQSLVVVLEVVAEAQVIGGLAQRGRNAHFRCDLEALAFDTLRDDVSDGRCRIGKQPHDRGAVLVVDAQRRLDLVPDVVEVDAIGGLVDEHVARDADALASTLAAPNVQYFQSIWHFAFRSSGSRSTEGSAATSDRARITFQRSVIGTGCGRLRSA
ncbi:Uncharacterised protein [Mycobacteroides abscessus subsp. abscessus]|nr:Uncharacterised protein [Mycobacteroides abscessus subsp. abscessus]